MNLTKGDDWVNGGAGNDSIYSSDGDDVLRGESGRDTLWSGYGDDILIGGTGADRFMLDLPPASGQDHVLDFTPEEGDLIVLRLSGKSQNHGLSLDQIKDVSEIRWTNDSDAGRKNTAQITVKNDRAVNDTIIYNTKGTADTGDDLIIMVLEDFSTELTLSHFDIW